MRALLQRVEKASVTIKKDNNTVAKIAKGLVVFLGVKADDTEAEAEFLANKTANLRIFADENDKLNLSVQQIEGEILVVSQFTLYADCEKGRRPFFGEAALPDKANELYEFYIEKLKSFGLTVKTGVFQANMLVDIVNDGPVTILLEK